MAEKHLQLFSFGYKYGSPLDVNFLVDVRHLPNPYWEETLRLRTGLDPETSDFVLRSPEGDELKEALRRFLQLWMTQQAEAGKLWLRVAVGCTGGRHRSVAMVEYLASVLGGDWEVEHFHRDVEKDMR